MDTMLATIGIVVKEPWAVDISYEMLNYTLYRVEDGGDGCGYIALKDNIGVTPGSDDTVWRKAVQAGQSIYDLAVKYHHFVGTEEEFEAQYQAALQAALDAAASAAAAEAQVEAAEALRVQAESSRESAETARAAAESARATAETARETAESARASAESSRASAETGRATAETARQTAETTRQSNEDDREEAEGTRTQQFEALKADMQVAIGQADAAATAATEAAASAAQTESDIEAAEASRVTAEQGRVTAEQGRASAEQSRANAESARVTAEAARETQAGADHTRAESDHTQAGTDHTQAGQDHTRAESDHSTAAQDHTQAGVDHTRAESDHTRAESDHASIANKADKDTDAIEGNLAQFDSNGNPVDSGEKIGDYAKKDGYYQTLTAGAAEKLVGDPIAVTDGYTEKPLALGPNGEMNEVADGRIVMNEVRGRAMAWNQLAETPSPVAEINGITRSLSADGKGLHYSGTSTVSANYSYGIANIVKGHKYYVCGRGIPSDCRVNIASNIGENSAIYTAIDSSLYFGVYIPSGVEIDADIYFTFIDLTLEFGSGHEPATVEQAEAMLASRRRMKPYWPQNPGTLLGARLLGWSMPRTANLLNPTTKNARLVSYTNPGNTNNEHTIIGFDQLTGAAIQFTPDATGVAESVTIDAENHFVIPGTGTLEIVASGQDPIGGDMAKVCVYMTWDGSMDDKVVAYNGYNVPFDSANVYHKSGDVYTQVFEGGLMKATGDGANNVRDRLYFDELSQKCCAELPVGEIDWNNLGNLERASQRDRYVFKFDNVAKGFSIGICSRMTQAEIDTLVNNMTFGIGYSKFAVRYDDATTTSGFVTAMQNLGIKLWYRRKESDVVAYTSDLYYKTGENTYVPLEEVWPLVGFGCNWATETLEEQADDVNGQPTSITPETVENFTTDLKEATKTLIDAQGDNVDLAILRSNLVAMCDALKIAGVVADYSISENPTSGVFSFSFTPNA